MNYLPRLVLIAGTLTASTLVLACSSPTPPEPAPSDAAATDAADIAADIPADIAADVTADATPTWPLPPPTTLGGIRPARLQLPADYDAKTPLPVVLLLGGYDNLAQDLDDWLHVAARVDALHFALLLPDGQTDTAGSPYWNATDTCCDYDGAGVDDVAYLTGLLDELAAKVPVDLQRVVVLGHSAGGFMAYRLACEQPQRFAAVVSLAGSGFLDPQVCVPQAPVNILQVHGLADDVMPFAGDDEAPGALEMLQRWAGYDGCNPASWANSGETHDLATGKVAQETQVFRAAGCQPGFGVELWQMTSEGHYPDYRPAFTDAALAWALAHPRP